MVILLSLENQEIKIEGIDKYQNRCLIYFSAIFQGKSYLSKDHNKGG